MNSKQNSKQNSEQNSKWVTSVFSIEGEKGEKASVEANANLKSSPSLHKALCDPIHFPSKRNLPQIYKLENQPPTDYYKRVPEGFIVQQCDWAFLGEVTSTESFTRPVFVVQTRFFEEGFVIAVYPESPQPRGLNFAKVMVGDTIALLVPRKKTFMDGREGVRLEQLNTCWVFKATLADVMDEANKLLSAQDAKAQKTDVTCFSCKKVAKSCCGKCKKAYFCSRECQTKAWPRHKLLCPDSSKLLALASIPRYTAHPGSAGEGLTWDNIRGYKPLPSPPA